MAYRYPNSKMSMDRRRRKQETIEKYNTKMKPTEKKEEFNEVEFNKWKTKWREDWKNREKPL